MRKGTGEVSVRLAVARKDRRTRCDSACVRSNLWAERRRGVAWITKLFDIPLIPLDRRPSTKLNACIARVWGNDFAGRTHRVSAALPENRSYH